MYSLKRKLFDIVGPPEDDQNVIFCVKAVDTTGLPEGKTDYITLRKVFFQAKCDLPESITMSLMRYGVFIRTGDNMTDISIEYFDEYLEAHSRIVSYLLRVGALARHVEKPQWWP